MVSPCGWPGNCSLVELWKTGETKLFFHGHPDIPGVYSPNHYWNLWFGKCSGQLDLYLRTRNCHLVPLSNSKPYAWGSLFTRLSVWSRSGNKNQKRCYWFKWSAVNKSICLGMVPSATPGSNWNPLKGPDDSGPELLPSIPFPPSQLLRRPRTPVSKWTMLKRSHGPEPQWSRSGSLPQLVAMWTCGTLGFCRATTAATAGESLFSHESITLQSCLLYIFSGRGHGQGFTAGFPGTTCSFPCAITCSLYAHFKWIKKLSSIAVYNVPVRTLGEEHPASRKLQRRVQRRSYMVDARAWRTSRGMYSTFQVCLLVCVDSLPLQVHACGPLGWEAW